MHTFKQQYDIAHLWADINREEATIEVARGPKVWYIPFNYGDTRLVIDKYTFRTAYGWN